jgi:FkbM family methyltransferase
VQGSIGELRLWLRPADRTTGEAFWSGRFEEDFVALLTALLDPGTTVVDVGANVGMIGLRLAARLRAFGAGRVLCVEPNPANAFLLRASVDLNDLDAFCAVFEVGLADKAGVAMLFAEGRGQRSGNGGLVAPKSRRRLAKTAISLRTLDALLDDAGEPEIALIKVDVEGGELAVLRGGTRTIARCRPLILGEFHGELMARRGETFVDVMDLLVPFGYRAFAFAGRRHLVEVPPEPGRGGVLLATSEHLPRLIENRHWRVDLA